MFALAALLAAGPSVRRAAVAVLAEPLRLLRSGTAGPVPQLDRLIVSQLGFAPGGPKRFTSPVPFDHVTVVDARTGGAVWRGARSPRRLPTALLGAAVPEVWLGDLTAFEAPGRYRLLASNGLASAPFTIAPDVFDTALRLVQRVFYFQRAFTAVETRYAGGPWVHATDAGRAPPGVTGGWHDAGDYSLYNMTTVSSLFWLLEAHRDFAPADDDTNLPESGNGQPDLLDEARRGLDWLLSVQTTAGGVRNSTCLASYAAYGRNPIESGAAYVEGEVGTIPTARAVGILADAADAYRAVDAAYAARLLAAARRGWEYLDARPGEHSDGSTCAAYRQDGDARAGRAVRMFAAAGLLVATGEEVFRTAFERAAVDITDPPSPYRFAAYAGLLYRRAAAADPARRTAVEGQLAALAASIAAAARSHPFEWTGRYVWGSIGVGLEHTGLLAAVCRWGSADAPAPCTAALASLDYLFGRNLLGLAYVSGVPGVGRARAHAFHHWLATLRATPFLFPGAIAGGPNEHPEPNDGSRPLARPRPVWGYWGDPAMPRSAATPIDARYTDNDSWSTNELAIAWQAPAVYALTFARWRARQPAGRLGAGEVAAQPLDDPSGGAAVAVGIHR